MLPIVKAPNDVLSATAAEIKTVDASMLRLIADMKETLLGTHDPEGVGLAAPQVGKSVQLFIAKPTKKAPFFVCINPKMVSESETMQELGRPKRSKAPAKLEGCLSLQDVWGTVRRHATVTIQYQLITENSQLITKKQTFTGFLATIIQHEMDHLQGVLFPKRVFEQQGKLYKSHKDKKNEDVFEEIEL